MILDGTKWKKYSRLKKFRIIVDRCFKAI